MSNSIVANPAVAWLGAAIIAVAGLAAGAGAETTWQKHHPRQHQVLKAANAQTARTHHILRNGKLTAAQARTLNREDRAIKAEDRRDTKINGGFITIGEKKHMVRQMHGIGKQRGHDVKADATAK